MYISIGLDVHDGKDEIAVSVFYCTLSVILAARRLLMLTFIFR